MVRLRERLHWFEHRPLFGQRIVVTRSREQASDLVKALSDLGADCLECPTIRVVPPDDPAPLDRALGRLQDYDWVVFTSVNGVSGFFERLFALNRDVRALGHLRTAAIGPVTAARLKSFGLASDLVPETFQAEAVVEAFRRQELRGRKVLLPRAQEARPVLPEQLSALGASVHEVAVYRTVPADMEAGALAEMVGDRPVDLLTFTSSSTVTNFQALLRAGDPAGLGRTPAACIGPITAETARGLGFDVRVTAETYTIPGLCRAILAHYGAAGGQGPS